ncbi:MAG: hypothetical protein JO139_09385 [Alphaproteobacteria bacterium]|nr:hypothetical protein [Alphaproteobacteria bacterium]MBV8335414.1 hypothetical protein [Alphaproteobacteria bacterium]
MIGGAGSDTIIASQDNDLLFDGSGPDLIFAVSAVIRCLAERAGCNLWRPRPRHDQRRRRHRHDLLRARAHTEYRWCGP